MDVLAVARAWLGGRQCAVSLTYDGPDISHVETVIPCLSEYELFGTFYLDAPMMLDHSEEWKLIANAGHEMGCHPFFTASDGRGNLPNWTLEMVDEDLRMSKRLLVELFPDQSLLSFAYPGDQTSCVSTSYDPSPASYRETITRQFDFARSTIPGTNSIIDLDLGWLKSFDTEGMNGSDLIALCEQNCQPGNWLILRFGEVGVGQHAIDEMAHRQLCAWLRDREQSVLVGNICELASKLRFVKSNIG